MEVLAAAIGLAIVSFVVSFALGLHNTLNGLERVSIGLVWFVLGVTSAIYAYVDYFKLYPLRQDMFIFFAAVISGLAAAILLTGALDILITGHAHLIDWIRSKK